MRTAGVVSRPASATLHHTALQYRLARNGLRLFSRPLEGDIALPYCYLITGTGKLNGKSLAEADEKKRSRFRCALPKRVHFSSIRF